MNKTNFILKIIMVLNFIVIITMFFINKDVNNLNYLWFFTELMLNIIFFIYLFTKSAKKELIINIIITIFLIGIMCIIPVYRHTIQNIRSSNSIIVNSQDDSKILAPNVIASYIETTTVIKNIYGIKIYGF